jgi:hypothetical protein
MICWNRFGLFARLCLLLLLIVGGSGSASAAGNLHLVFKRQDPLDTQPIDAVVIIESDTAPTQSALTKNDECLLTNVRAGAYTVTVHAFSAHQAVGSFKIDVNDDRTTMKRILLGKTYSVGCLSYRSDYLRYLSSRSKEVEGYGLYTYLLLPKRPVRGSAREQVYLCALQTWYDRSPGFDGNGRKADRARCNIVYLPVRPSKNNDWQADYDWDRAARLLAKLNLSERDGPLLVISRYPLSAALPRNRAGQPDATTCLVVDFSHASLGTMAAWSEDLFYESNHFDYAALDLLGRLAAYLSGRWSAAEETQPEPATPSFQPIKALPAFVKQAVFLVNR